MPDSNIDFNFILKTWADIPKDPLLFHLKTPPFYLLPKPVPSDHPNSDPNDRIQIIFIPLYLLKQFGMKNHTSSLLLLGLMLATVSTLNLHPHLSSSHHSAAEHDVARVDHDTTQQYTLYRDTLDMIGSHTIITPPSVIPTAQLPTTSFTSLACTQMTNVERGMLALDLVLIRDKLTQVRQALLTTTLTRAIYKIKTDVTNQQLLTKTMDIIIASNCSANANLQATAMQSNLVVDRWMLGNIPMAQLIQEYTDRSLTNQYVTNCPEETPWYTPDGCVPCNETEFFNLETQFCEECPDFDWPTHTCISDIGIMNETNGTNQTVSSGGKIAAPVRPGTNPAAKNNTPTVPAGKTPAGANNSQNGKPSANNTKPATKPTGNTTKPAANETKPAANATKPEANATHPATNATHPATNATNATKPEANATHPTPNTTHPSTNPQNPQNPTNPSGKETPSTPQNPNENPTNPSTAKPNATVPSTRPNSSNTKVSETNPEDQKNSTNQENPDQSKNATAPAKPNTTAPANATKPNATAPANETKPKANETETKPNATTQANATKPNATTPANETKPNSTAPSNQTKANATSPSANKTNTTAPTPPPKAPVLPPNATNPKISDRVLLSSPSAQPKESSSDIPCPQATPFYNGTACIQCNAPHNLFDLAKKQCSSCPDQFNFNSSSNTCEKINNDFLTAKTSANLINAGMSTNYWNYLYDNVKSKNATVKNCPIATPYYSNLNKCVACYAPMKYFNLETRQCQNCAAPFVYNETQRDCIDMSQSDHPVSGNALKMSGTIFSHQAELLQLLHGNSLSFRPSHQ